MELTTQKQSLYNIQQEHLSLLAAIEDNDGLLEPWMEEALVLSDEAIHAKGLSYGWVIKRFSDEAEVIDKEIKRLQLMKKRADKMADLIKERLSEAMIQFGIEKIESPTLKLSFRKSEVVEVDADASFPLEYCVVKDPEVSKTKLKEALKEGVKIEGARLVTKQNLQIK